MKRVIVKCGCSAHIATIDTDNGNDGMEVVHRLGLCTECDENDGDYVKSSCWDHKRDAAERKRVADAMALNAAMKDVKPMKRGK